MTAPRPWEEIPSSDRTQVTRVLYERAIRDIREATHAARSGDLHRALRAAVRAERYLSAAVALGRTPSEATLRNLATMRQEVGSTIDSAADELAEVMP